MNAMPAPKATTSNEHVHSAPLLERGLVLLFAVLIVIDLLYFALGLASLPLYYRRVSTLTIEPYYQLGD